MVMRELWFTALNRFGHPIANTGQVTRACDSAFDRSTACTRE